MNSSGMFTLNWLEIKSSIVLGIVVGLGFAVAYVLGVGSIWNVELHKLLDVFTIGFLSSIGAFIKNLLTTDSGRFLGLVKVK